MGCIRPLTFILAYWKKCNLPGFGGPAAVTGLWVDFAPVRLNVLLSINVNLMKQTRCVAKKKVLNGVIYSYYMEK